MLQRQDLTPVAQRILGKETNFRQAVEHHELWLDALEGFKNHLDGFAELKIRRIQQALLLIRV